MTNFNLKFILFSFIVFLSFEFVFAQNQRTGLAFIRNYSPKEYGQHIQNWAILQDQRGMMYIGNGNGVMEYDGESFRLIEFPDKATTRSMAIDTSNRVYVGSVGDFGYLEPDSLGRTKYVSLVPETEEKYHNFADVWDTEYNGEYVLF